MKEQNFKNHTQLVFGWHGLTFFAILAVLIGSFINLNGSAPENKYSASLICVITLICCFFFAYVRIFALKAQDRAIRAEENLRHFALTGKLLPAGLTVSQIVALRFASDEEFPALATKAAAENLSNKQIKLAIQNWRADWYRV
ncbi:MAG: DUF6526 family protein [Sediminibacterium sp.]|uniref:DUF6526 family protein n=1 Tax=Sediminibacterium sp. TaxID=1917865 RepID=UPI002716808A|nr:DUF6526 family protein [Sediminibacterium sp.]MDO8997428.1 DUF6526 family protein [Sediminibacterium sp.]